MKESAENISPFPVWLIDSKVVPDEQLVSLIDRPALVRKLNAGLNGKLTIVSAPAGYGKTTLIGEWRRSLLEKGYLVAWLSLDEDDSTPRILTTYLAFSLWEAGLQTYIRAVSEDGFSSHMSPRTILGILSAAVAMSEKKLILFLDDFEKLGSNCVRTVIEPALKYFPSNLHVAIACRTKGGLSLSELRLGGWTNELNSADMKFSPFEIKNFLGQFLKENELKQIVEKSEGWPVALQYLRIAMSRSNDSTAILKKFKGTGQEISDYFSEQFLHTLPENQKAFLLETSILDYVDIQTADYIRNRTDSEFLLESMRGMEAFIMLLRDSESNYRLHRLLREFLQEHLRLNYADRYRILHQRAAAWISGEGHIIRSIRYALEIGETETAADIMENAGGVLLWNREGMIRIRAAYALLPNEIIVGRPRLLLIKALISLKDGKLNDAREILQHVRSIASNMKNDVLKYETAIIASTLAVYEGTNPDEDIRQLEIQLGELGKEKAQISFIHTTKCVSSIQYGHFDRAIEVAYKGIAVLQDSKMPSAASFGIAYFNFHLGTIYFAQGNLGDSFSRYEKARNSIRRYFSNDKDMTLISNVLMAEWCFERNEITRAQKLLGDTNKRLVNGEAWYEIYAAGYSTSSAIAYEQEGLPSCNRQTEGALEYIQREGLKRLRTLIIANNAGYQVRSGKAQQARKLVQKNGLSLEDYKTPEKENSLIRERYGVVTSLCRLLIAEKLYGPAVSELSFFIAVERAINHNRAILKYSLLLSVALFFSGKKKKSFDLLSKVLSRTRKEGFVRLVLDEAPFVNGLLVAYKKSRTAPEKDHAAYLLSFIENGKSKKEVIRLSKRECQVLEQLSEGHPDKIIAWNLDVSENTVRFHLKNIFIKLGVNSRLQAVKEAPNLIVEHPL